MMGFYGDLSKVYELLFPVQSAQIGFLSRRAEPGAPLLDVGAGSGNQAGELARKGYDVTATDLSEEMVGRIMEQPVGNGRLQAFASDLLRLGERLPEDSFELIYCIGNTLVHLDGAQEIEEALQVFRRLLKPGGMLVIQIVNYDRIIRDAVSELPVIRRQLDGGTATFIRKYDPLSGGKLAFTGRLELRQDIAGSLPAEVAEAAEDTVEVHENTVPLYPLQSAELQRLLAGAGFAPAELFGGFDEAAYTAASPALIATARKP